MRDLCAKFYNSDKDIAIYPVEWKRGPNGLRSLKLTVPLEVEGVIAEGFSLIGNTLVDLPERNVTFILNYSDPSGYGHGVHLGKAEWKPISGHNNKGWGPAEWQLKEMTCSHCHCFNDNLALGGDVWKKRKLPLALPITPDPDSFDDFLEFVGEKFRILNTSLIPTPPWDTEWQQDLQM